MDILASKPEATWLYYGELDGFYELARGVAHIVTDPSDHYDSICCVGDPFTGLPLSQYVRSTGFKLISSYELEDKVRELAALRPKNAYLAINRYAVSQTNWDPRILPDDLGDALDCLVKDAWPGITVLGKPQDIDGYTMNFVHPRDCYLWEEEHEGH